MISLLKIKGSTLVIYLLVIITLAFFILPLYIMVTTSVKTPQQVFASPTKWIPNPVISEYYMTYISNPRFWTFFKNSVIITMLNVLGAVIVNPIVAFAFARLRWPLRNVFFFLLLGTLMLPEQVTVIPLYIVFLKLRWLNTYLPLIVPNFFGHPVFIFLLRQFILAMPKDILDAGRIDGCNNYRLYWNLTFPQLAAPIATIAIFRFMWTWNDFFRPLIYINRTRMKTLALGLMDLIAEAGRFTILDWGQVMTLTTLTLLPCFVIFFLLQRLFVKGIHISSVNL